MSEKLRCSLECGSESGKHQLKDGVEFMLANSVTLDARAEAKRGGGGRESWGKLSEWRRAGERGPANGAPKRAGD